MMALFLNKLRHTESNVKVRDASSLSSLDSSRDSLMMLLMLVGLEMNNLASIIIKTIRVPVISSGCSRGCGSCCHFNTRLDLLRGKLLRHHRAHKLHLDFVSPRGRGRVTPTNRIFADIDSQSLCIKYQFIIRYTSRNSNTIDDHHMVAFNEYGNRVILFKIVALVAVHHKIVEIVFSRWNFLKYFQ